MEGPKTDRFGFLLNPSGLSIPSTENSRKEISRLEKWSVMLEADATLRSSKFRSRLLKGIPDAFRGIVWTRLELLMYSSSSSPSSLPPPPGNYSTQLRSTSEGTKTYDNICKDLTRTFPKHVYFQTLQGTSSLERVLCGYALMDSEVGFTQGMSFIAAMFLLYLTEKRAMSLFVSVMTKRPCLLRKNFQPSMEGVHLRLYQYSELLKRHLPVLDSHFKEIDFEPNMYAVNWFASVFTASGLPFVAVVRIWDVFLLQGWSFVLAVALSFFKLHHKQVLRIRDFEGMLAFLKTEMTGFQLIDKLISTASLLPIAEQDLEALEAKFVQQRRV